MLAVQGPRSREILGKLAPEVNDLPYFGLTPAKIGDAPVTISRTGYTGDLGFEVFVEADDALGVLDKVIQAGDGQGFRPFGEDALMMLRIEAGLSLINVEFSSARFAFTDAERFTPKELGFGWMLGKGGADARRGPAVHRPPCHRARAARGHLALGDGRPVGRLAGVRAAPPRARPGRAQGREPGPVGVDAVRRHRTATSASATPPA